MALTSMFTSPSFIYPFVYPIVVSMASIKNYTAKDGSETWRVRYRLQGRSCSKTFANQQSAETFGEMVDRWGPEQALAFIKQPTTPRVKSITVGESIERFIALRTGSTHKSYRNLSRRHIIPALGATPVNKLTPELVQLWMLGLTLSPGTVTLLHSILSGALAQSVSRGEIATNPAARWSKTNQTGVRLPRSRSVVTPIFLTDEEYEIVLSAIPDHYETLVEFLYNTGCRIGEACALKPADVNLHTGKVHFHGTVASDEEGNMVIGATKTESSDREIAVPRRVLNQLDLTQEFVFTTRNGGMLTPDHFRCGAWRKAMTHTGLPKHRTPRIHDLRHTHASRLLNAGISIHAVKERLGHSDIMTTLRTYGHAAGDSESRILDVLTDPPTSDSQGAPGTSHPQ